MSIMHFMLAGLTYFYILGCEKYTGLNDYRNFIQTRVMSPECRILDSSRYVAILYSSSLEKAAMGDQCRVLVGSIIAFCTGRPTTMQPVDNLLFPMDLL